MAKSIPKDIRASLYLDDKPAKKSIRDLQLESLKLRKELNGLTIGTDAWNAKMKQVSVHSRALSAIQAEVRGVGGAFSWLKTEVGRFGTLAAGYLGFQMITSQFQNIIAGNAKLSDSLADIRRVASLTEEEVLRLDQSFGKLDTRTSRTELRGIAFIAGKMGVAKDEILGFVGAVDKLVVSLGDELGNADQVTTQLGKILNVFDGTVNGDNITHLGNAMVKLAHDGVASAGFISDFTQRLSGMAKTSGMSLGSVLGLGAGLEEMGARVESSATAIQKLLVNMGQDIPGSAKVAGMSVDEFNKMFASAPQEALIAYAEGLTQNKAAFAEVAAAFKDAGEEGVRVIETLTKIGERADFMRDKIKDGNQSILEATEINQAFALMNETLGAKVDKLTKKFYSMVTSKGMMDFFIAIVDGAMSSAKWIERNATGIKNFAKIITTAVIAWTAYNLAVRISTATLVTWRTATISASLAKAIFTGNIAQATRAMAMLNIAIKANPIGLLVSAVVAASTAFYFFNGRLSDAQKNVKNLADAQMEAEKATLAERLEIERASKTLTANNSLLDDKFEAIKALRRIMPDVLKDYSDEEIMAGKAADAIKGHTAAILERAKANAYYNKVQSIQEEVIDLEGQKKRGLEGATFGERFDVIGTKFMIVGSKSEAYEKEIQKRIDAKNAESEALADSAKEVVTFRPRKSTVEDNEILGQGDEIEKTVIKTIKWYDDEIAALKKKQSEEAITHAQYKGIQAEIIQLEKERDKITGGKPGKTKSVKLTEAEKLQGELEKINEEIFLNSLNESDKEFESIRLKYEKLRVLAKGDEAQLAEMERLQVAEAFALQEKITAKAEEEAYKQYLAKQDAIEAISTGLMSENELELEQTRKKYMALLQMADKFELDKAGIIQAWSDENTKIQERQAIAAAEKKQREDSKWKLTDKEYEQEKKDFMVQMASEAANATFDIIRNSNQAKLDAAVSSIERERDAELSNKNLTEEQKQRINDKYDAKLREAKQKAWKADQAAAIAQAIVNGAVAVTKVLAQTGILSPFAIPAIAAGTAIQLAAIASQKMPQFAVGGFSDKDPAGYVSQATLFNNSSSGRPFIAGEAGKEWIAPNWMVTSPRFANIIGMLESARQEKRMFAGGGSTEVAPAPAAGGSYDFQRLEGLMGQMLVKLDKVKDQKVYMVYKDWEDFGDDIDNSRKIQGRS